MATCGARGRQSDHGLGPLNLPALSLHLLASAPSPRAAPGARALLEARGLSVSVNGALLVRGVDLVVAPGEIVWVSGPSGAGKSTLLRALARLIPAAEGELRLEGAPAGSVKAHDWRARVSLLPHPPIPLAPTVGEDLAAPWRLGVRKGLDPPHEPERAAMLARLGLEEIGLARPTRELSQGQMARVALARSLLARPRVLLLDEPTANLDTGTAGLVAGAVRRFTAQGAAAVVAAHSEPWEGVARVLRLHRGRAEAAR